MSYIDDAPNDDAERCQRLGIIVKQASDGKYVASFGLHVLAVGDTLEETRRRALELYDKM